MLKRLIESLRPSDFQSSHSLFELPARGRPSHTLLITCSDLRTNPFQLISTNAHDLHVVQNFGNLVPRPDPHREEETQVEGLVGLYQVRHLVVCGHAPCGVLKTLLSPENAGLPRAMETAGRLQAALKTREIVSALRDELDQNELLAEAARVNVLVQLENLRATPAISDLLDQGDLHLHGWVYQNGSISAYDPHRAEFVGLSQ